MLEKCVLYRFNGAESTSVLLKMKYGYVSKTKCSERFLHS